MNLKVGKQMRFIGLLVGISLPGILLIAWQAPGMVEHLNVKLPPPAVLMLSATIQTLVLVVALAALTYGGIVEEVLLRWGVMSLLTWLVFLLIGRRNLGMALILGNALAAILFGLGHLPAVIVMVGAHLGMAVPRLIYM